MHNDSATEDTPLKPADDGLLLMGEQASVVREWVATTRVRVHKRIVTEIQTLEVEVRREELVVTPEPIAAHDSYVVDVGHAPVAPEPSVYALRAEVPSVTLNIWPVEKVTITVDKVDGAQEVTTALRATGLKLLREPATE